MAAPAYTNLKLTIPGIKSDLALASTAVGLTLPNGSPWTLPVIPDIKLGQGATAGKFDIISKLYVVSATGATAYDILGGTLLDPLGNALIFANVRGYLILNFSVTAGFVLKHDGTATNAWLAPFDAIATSKNVIQPGWTDSGGTIIPGYLLNQTGAAAGMAGIDSTHKIISLNAGANTFYHGLLVWGVSA